MTSSSTRFAVVEIKAFQHKGHNIIELADNQVIVQEKNIQEII